jgi:hypothetical protein
MLDNNGDEENKEVWIMSLFHTTDACKNRQVSTHSGGLAGGHTSNLLLTGP